jgi:hypothetical protein
MGRVHVEFLPFSDLPGSSSPRTAGLADSSDDEDEQAPEPGPTIYVCASCGAHLTKFAELISRDFRGRSGKASLFHAVVNTIESPPEDRMLITGKHVRCCPHSVGN